MKKFVMVLLCVLCLSVICSAAEPEKSRDFVLTETLGASIGFALYNSHVIIGITADTYSKKIYTQTNMIGIINEQKSALVTLDDYVLKLIQLSQDPKLSGDRATLQEILECTKKINAMSDALLKYISSPTNSNADDFDTKRKASYGSIDKLLGLKN